MKDTTREFLLWCAPALLLGLALRIILTAHMPYAFYHDDAPDFLATADNWLNAHRLNLHSKKTFLVPILFSLPFLFHLPALITIPIFQHLLGLVLIVMVGLLCRLWFVKWRIFIVPLTVVAALNPFLLWYEHTLMAETTFVFTTVLVALAGTLYALEQTRGRFVFLLVALFLEAGARPEGKLLFGFGIFLVVLLHARRWRKEWPRIAIIVAFAFGTHFITRTKQAGVLLYTSVLRLSPAELKSAPRIDSYVGSIRAELIQRWEEERAFAKVSHRKQIVEAVTRYLKDQRGSQEKVRQDINALCLSMAKEICRERIFSLPALVYYKFEVTSTEAPNDPFSNRILFDKQRRAYHSKGGRALHLAEGLTGEKIADDAALDRFVDAHYGEVPWFNAWQRHWLTLVNFLRLPDHTRAADARGAQRSGRGVPLYFLGAAIGSIAIMFRRGQLQPFHFAWGISLAAFFFIIILTANVRPRFRFVFEPFWYLYFALLFEMLWLGALARWKRRG